MSDIIDIAGVEALYDERTTRIALDLWRTFIAPLLPLEGLRALREAIVADSEELIQKGTVDWEQDGPPGMHPPCGACAIGYCWWKSGLAPTASAVLDRFRETADAVDVRISLDDTRSAGEFTNWFDYEDRTVVRARLLPEVEAAIRDHEQRKGGKAA